MKLKHNEKLPIISGIYFITNIINNKIYVGSSNNCLYRKFQHFTLLKQNKHHNIHLQNAYNKYGKRCFLFTIEEIVSENELLFIEQCYLDVCKIFPLFYYNINYIAAKPPSRKGIKITDPIILKKYSIAQKGKKIGIENHMYGKFGNKHHNYNNTIYTIKHENGKSYTGTYYDFYKTYNLDYRNVSALILRKRKSHKGWSI